MVEVLDPSEMFRAVMKSSYILATPGLPRFKKYPYFIIIFN